MFDKMKELMELKKQADRLKKELEIVTVECEEVRGIKITMNGAQTIRNLEIEQSLLVDKAKLERELARSFNAAVKKSQGIAAQKMRTLMPAGFPGM